jgi:hypothetical protein
MMTRLLAASISTSGPSERSNGKFHGTMLPTTPLGWYRTPDRAVPNSVAQPRKAPSAPAAWMVTLVLSGSSSSSWLTSMGKDRSTLSSTIRSGSCWVTM